MPVQMHASWVDAQAFSGLWTPLPDADEFLLLSCYVSPKGWARIEEFIRKRAQQSRSFSTTLVFSLSGMRETDAEALIGPMARMSSGRVRIFVMDDTTSLFHPKAHGSSAGGRTRLVVGSANLTAGGMDRNYELMTVIDDVAEPYTAFRASVASLIGSGKLRELKREDEQTVKHIVREARQRAQERHLADRNNGGEKRVKPGSLVDEPILPPASDAFEALHRVRALSQQGVFLVRSDKPDSLSVSVPLDSFRNAKVTILEKQTTTMVAGAVEVGQGSRSLSVPLIPKSVSDALAEYLDPLGRLVGRYSAETLGGKWMPRAWSGQFVDLWSEQADKFSVKKHRKEINRHLEELPKLLSGKRAVSKKLLPELTVRPPREWGDMAAAKRLLKWNDTRDPVNLTETVKEIVIKAILEHAKAAVGRRLSSEYVHAQLSALGFPPFMRSSGQEMDVKEAIFFLCDWIQAAAEPWLKSSKKELRHAPNRSFVVALLARRFGDRTDPAKVWKATVSWQSAVIDESQAHHRHLDAVLVEAWNSFHNWIGFDATTSPWEEEIPPRGG